ncbi:serine hydrolase [Arcicella rosea]|uniref:CubicO group peptidase (Beta-lactamase class C family) n=1 Tax=Arcicella rosea TaxID=502909 RepID=A0A841EUF5_9BACT|nr:serine hydrolase domain-containing protein [Arcicella rosea]MBB6004268.1 CubicO group peptidase (beta-lactamase class C family) [Arcicella rosea]
MKRLAIIKKSSTTNILFRYCTSIILPFFSLATLFGQVPLDSVNVKVNTLLASKVKESSPGVAVAIIKDGVLISKAVRGQANLDFQIPVDFNTSFNIASNAKQFTAACMLLLQKDGLISLDDDFRKYVPDILKNYPDKISIKNLLNHTSGFRDVYDLWALQDITWWQTFVSNTDAINLLKKQTDLNFKPSSQYLYSNSNYLILAEIVKIVTKTSLKDYIKAKIFEPLQMNQTAFVDDYMQVIPKRADGYGNFNGWKKYPWITSLYGDGGLFTTIDDQIKWEKHLHNPTLWDNQFNSVFLQPIKTENQTFYGFGLMFENYKGLTHTYHDGSTGAYNASFDRFPTEKISIIVMTNNTQVWTRGLSQELTALVIDKTKFIETNNLLTETETTNTQLHILGDYQFEDGRIIKIRKDSAGLYRDIYGRNPSKLKQETSSIYAYETVKDLKIKFIVQNKIVKSLTIFHPLQSFQTAIKLPNIKVEDNYYETLNGKYFNAETNTSIEIKHLKGNDYSLIKNKETQHAMLIRKDYLAMNSYQMLIERNSNNKIIGLKVNDNRILNVRFKKVK